MSDDIHALVERLYDHLEATAERPVDRDASRWIGEAEAVAGDVAHDDVPVAVLVDRIEHVDRLLSEVDDTGDPTANEHVAEAKRLAAAVRERVDQNG